MPFKHSVKESPLAFDSRISCSFKQLFALQNQASGFSFLPRQKASSVMSGRHQSKFRGRGLNFEELRNYQQGDDIRSLDWRVTLRTGKPHVRSYTEEKDHQIILCVDMRQSMFFSSVDTMKSVVAAEIASLCAWRVLGENDRIGALIISDQETRWFKPQRSQYQTMTILRKLSALSQELTQKLSDKSLNNSSASTSDTKSLNDVTQQLLKSSTKNAIYLFISDFHDFNEQSFIALKKLRTHNVVLPIKINDPLDTSLASQEGLVISDGDLQIALPEKNQSLNQRYEDAFKNQQASIEKLFNSQQIPSIALTTNGTHIKEFQRQMGGSR